MKQTNNVIHIKICNNSTLLILYFNCIIHLKYICIYIYIYIYIYIQTEQVNNTIIKHQIIL